MIISNFDTVTTSDIYVFFKFLINVLKILDINIVINVIINIILTKIIYIIQLKV